MFRTETTTTQVEYQVWVHEDGYRVFREGVHYDTIPYELVRIYVDEDTLLEQYLSGEYAYQTDRLPPNADDD